MTAVGNSNGVRQLPYINAAIVGTAVLSTGVLSVLAHETIAALTGSLIPLPTLAVTLGTSLFVGSTKPIGTKSLLERVQANPGAVYVGGLVAMVATHSIASSDYPLAAYAGGALLGGLTAERLSLVGKNEL